MSSHLKVRRIILLAFCSALVFVGKLALYWLPNAELVTFLLIIFTLTFTLKEALAISTVYTIVEILLWSLTEQFYIWTVIVLTTYLFKNLFKENFILWSIFSAFFGLSFGFLSAIPIMILLGLDKAITYWGLGFVPFDIPHMIYNYFFMLLLGRVVYKNIQILLKDYYR